MMPDVHALNSSLVPMVMTPERAEELYGEIFAQQSVSAYYAAPDDGDPHWLPQVAA